MGISYLDRPHPAGYFIFPDLSVRHEGQYRLTFVLFEALKDPQDADLNSPNNEVAGSHYHNRCEVQTAAFHVYSAKKFPGLTESTLLSRVVADQGCRVRIRRDVRMRRRGSKDDKDWEVSDTEAVTAEGAPTDVPASAYETKLIGSAVESSDHSDKPDSVPSSASTHTLQAPPSTQPGQQTMQAQAGFTYPHWYQYSPASQSSTQHMYAPYVPSEQAYMQHQHPYQNQYTQSQNQAMGQIPQYSPYGYQQPTPNTVLQNNSISQQPPSQQQVSPTYPHSQEYSSNTPMRPQAAAYHPAYGHVERDAQNSIQYSYQQPPPQPMGYQQSTQPQVAYSPQTPQQTLDSHDNAIPASSAPLVSGKPLPPLEVPRVSHTTADALVSPIHATAASKQPGRMGPPNGVTRAPPPQLLSQAVSGVGQKRSYGATFNTLHTEEAMRNGARPNADHVPDWSYQNEEDLQDLESIKMTYRRADGSYTVVSPRQFHMP